MIVLIAITFFAVPFFGSISVPRVTDPDYRIPYALSKDYWLYEHRLRQAAVGNKIFVLGDSVVWGEYVRPDGTLSHFLGNDNSKHHFINAGLNGLFPLAMHGLVEHYGSSLAYQKVIVHCNALWMTSPRADLSTDKEEPFNHSRLVPQFFPRIPCYRANVNERLSAVVERHVPFFQWVTHLQSAYYQEKSIPQWTLIEDGNEPPDYPNAWRNPLAPLRGDIPAEPGVDPLRGPTSRRHRPWNRDGAEPIYFEWVSVEKSLQWRAFRGCVEILQNRHVDVLVVFGPFNEHMIADDQGSAFAALRGSILRWLSEHQIPTVAPKLLPSDDYADASHPLTGGYELLAREISDDPTFQNWLTH